jgi:hypothetical protein
MGADVCETDGVALTDTLGLESVGSTVVGDRRASDADLEDAEKSDVFQAISAIAPVTPTIAKDNEVFRFIAL